MGLSPLPPSAGLICTSATGFEPPLSCSTDRPMASGGGHYLFHQTPSGSTLCQLGAMDPNLCSPASSQSGSQPRLVHLSGGANDSGLSSLSGGTAGGGFGAFGHQPILLHQQNFSPAGMRGTELEELEPQPRDRCNTWPLRRAMGIEGSQTSPLIHDRIPEEESMYEEEEGGGQPGELQQMSDSSCTLAGVVQSPLGQQQGQAQEHPNPEERSDSAIGGDCSSRTDSPPSSGAKKCSTRRNAWGNMSYADLITQAILASPEKRLTLSQVYEWMVSNVPYFRDKGDSNSSAGWKNSIRHNLSLHSRFMRIQNEGAGKSSWWVINPDAKPGRNPRRRANTMESASKAVMDKKRRGTRKRVDQLVQQKTHQPGGPCSSATSMASIQDMFPEGPEDADLCGANSQMTGGGTNFDTFRPRAQSTLSIAGPSSRLSPTLETTGFEDIPFPSWMDQPSQPPPALPQQHQTTLNPQQVNELLDRTDQMRLDARLNGVKESTAMGGSTMLVAKSELVDPQPTPVTMKQEPLGVAPPPSYQELSSIRRPGQLQSNSLLRQMPQMVVSQLKMGGSPGSMNMSVGQPQHPTATLFTSMGQQQFGVPAAGAPFQWNPAAGSLPAGQLMGVQQQFINLGSNGALPLDLSDVNAMSVDQALLAGLDMDEVLRHDMAQGGQMGQFDQLP